MKINKNTIEKQLEREFTSVIERICSSKITIIPNAENMSCLDIDGEECDLFDPFLKSCDALSFLFLHTYHVETFETNEIPLKEALIKIIYDNITADFPKITFQELWNTISYFHEKDHLFELHVRKLIINKFHKEIYLTPLYYEFRERIESSEVLIDFLLIVQKNFRSYKENDIDYNSSGHWKFRQLEL